jgi:transposase-like protein
MSRNRSYSIEFKRQVSQEYLAGDTLHGIAKRHGVNRSLIRLWVEKYEACQRRSKSLPMWRRKSPPLAQ